MPPPCNLRVEWENGEIEDELLNTIVANDLVSCAAYGRDYYLINLPGWKRFKALSKRQKKIFLPYDQAKLCSYRMTPRNQFRYEAPRNNNDDYAISIDKKNGNNKWEESIKLEAEQQYECNTCKDLGQGHAPQGCKKICTHFVFDAKHDGRHKARLVANEHLTEAPL